MGINKNLFFTQLNIGMMDNFSYIFADLDTHEALLIDPGFDCEKIMTTLKDNNLKLVNIFLTHHHFDHVNETARLKKLTGAKVYCHSMTAKFLKSKNPSDETVKDGDKILTGNSLEALCIETPGHSPGSMCLIINDKYLVTGDTLFIGDCGRTDLLESNSKAMFNSLQKLKALPDNLIVCPGHNYGTTPTNTLGNEKQTNPTLLADISAFA